MNKIEKLIKIDLNIEKINNEIPDINFGGCGTFSYHLSNTLNGKYGIENEFYYLPGAPAAIEYDILFSHIVIKVDDYFIDNNGFHNQKSGWCKDLIPLPKDKLEEMINIPELWNSQFYNKQNIEKLIDSISEI